MSEQKNRYKRNGQQFYSTGENKYTRTWIDVILLPEINF